ncbi:MAG: RES family NAD+ phosphorylase [Porticoccaceae bacterium]
MEIDDELSNKYICHQCIGDEYLSNDVRTTGKKHKCGYCGSREPAISLDELADRTEAAFAEHMERTPTDMSTYECLAHNDREGDFEWMRAGEPITDALQHYVRIQEEPASDLQELLSERHADMDAAAAGEECDFSEDSYYERKTTDGSRHWHVLWEKFEKELKERARLWNADAGKILERVFKDLNEVRSQEGKPIFVIAGPETSLTHVYRAREFASESDMRASLKTFKSERSIARELGPPPHRLARAGRMNAEGISVFYGATGEETALSEIRPVVGSYVAVGKFELVRKLRLLDLNLLKQSQQDGSIFDPSTSERRERALFLRDLSQMMVRPVHPFDEPFDYLSTQAIADYLATQVYPSIDGIIYPSVQANGPERNVVIFNKVATVADDGNYATNFVRDELGLRYELLDMSVPIYPIYPEGLGVPIPENFKTLKLVNTRTGFKIPENGKPRLIFNPNESLRLNPVNIVIHRIQKVKVQTHTSSTVIVTRGKDNKIPWKND